jgi:hypothetical protein
MMVVFGFSAPFSVLQAQTECTTYEWFIDGKCSAVDLAFDEGWHTIEPFGETRCAHDTDYKFWVRPGNEDVVLYFQGGGGCWDQGSCRAGSTFYKQHVGNNEPVSYRNGIFDFDNPDNPFSEHTLIFAPSCTGDVYMGSGVTDYGDDVVVHHRGFDNLMSAVNFTIDYVPNPDSVFVTGCSAGSIGSAIAIPFIIEAYPDATVTQLGDSLGTIFDTVSNMSNLWTIPDFYTDSILEFAPGLSEFTMADYYIGLGQAYPEQTFTQFNFQFDNVQQRFFATGEDNPAEFISDTLDTSLTRISDTVPNFRYFLADDDQHCILPRRDLYETELDGVSALEWITAIAQNQPVDNHTP